MKLSIIIPVYNERFWIRKFWQTFKLAPLDQCDNISSVEIIVVDDGSKDGTTAILESLCLESFRFQCGIPASVTFLKQPVNQGKGAAIRRGIDSSTGDIVLFQDADLEYSTEDYPKLLRPITDQLADSVFGSRFVGHPRRVLYFWHSVANKLLTLVCNAICNLNLTDMETCYKVMTGTLVRSLNLKSNRFGIEPEITIRLAQAKARIYEVPISYSGRTYEAGKKIRPRDGIAALYTIAKFGFFDTEPFKSGLPQTLNVLDSLNKAIYAPLLKRALGKINAEERPLRILEIGSGIGSLTSELLRYGEVVATDLSQEFIEKIRDRFRHYTDFSAMLWDATTTPLPALYAKGKFDLIVAFNVLEHLKEDERALGLWYQLLNNEGKLILLVPNYPGLFSPIDQAAGHFRRYNKKELYRKITGSGFTIEQYFYGNALGILGWILNGLILRRSILPQRQLRFYFFLKRFFGRFEAKIENYAGLNLIVVSGRR